MATVTSAGDIVPVMYYARFQGDGFNVGAMSVFRYSRLLPAAIPLPDYIAPR